MWIRGAALWVVWNTFLALIPVVLAPVVVRAADEGRSRGIARLGAWLLGFAWLAFLPNTCYLLTEWRHFLARLDASDLYLRSRVDVGSTLELMGYTAFFFCFSAVGMLTFTLAIRPMAGLARSLGMTNWIPAIPLFLLLSVGVYLGLVLRFNSWDLLTHPGEVWASAVAVLNRPYLSAFVIGFAGFLWLAYLAIDVWIDGFAARWKRASAH